MGQAKTLLTQASEEKKMQFTMQIEEQLLQEELKLDQQTHSQVMQLHQAALQQKAQLEQQAANLKMEYKKQHMQDSMAMKWYEIQMRQCEMQERMRHPARDRWSAPQSQDASQNVSLSYGQHQSSMPASAYAAQQFPHMPDLSYGPGTGGAYGQTMAGPHGCALDWDVA